MDERNERKNSVVVLIKIIVGLAVIAAIGMLIFWAFDYVLIAVVIGAAVTALLLLLIVLVTAQVTRRQTIETMQTGANIALQAQHVNDLWDARKTKALGDVMREGVRFGREQTNYQLKRPGQPLPPLLPPPSQDSRWLPEMANYGDEFIIDEEDSYVQR